MVSFFGLKLGGDKKKKDEKAAAEQRWPRQRKEPTPSRPEIQYRPYVGQPDLLNGSIRPVSRAQASHAGPPKLPSAPYGSHGGGGHGAFAAASSMVNLSGGSYGEDKAYPGVKSSASAADLRADFARSSQGLAIPLPAFFSRPGTAGSTRADLRPSPFEQADAPSTPKTLLGDLALSTDLSNDGEAGSSLLGDTPENVAQAIMSAVSRREEGKEEGKWKMEQGSRNAWRPAKGLGGFLEGRGEPKPEPEQATQNLSAALGSPIRGLPVEPTLSEHAGQYEAKFQDSAGASTDNSTSLPDKRLENRNSAKADSELAGAAQYSSSLLTDSESDPEALDEDGRRGSHRSPASTSPALSMSAFGDESQSQGGGKPVIQNVRAKRDTYTIETPRKQSLTMEIEELERSILGLDGQLVPVGNPEENIGSITQDDGGESKPILGPLLGPLSIGHPSPPLSAASPACVPPSQGQGLGQFSSEECGTVGKGATADPSPASPFLPGSGPLPQFRRPSWDNRDRDSHDSFQDKFTRPRPSPSPSPRPDLGISITAAAAPLTPDSDNWPLPSPTTSSTHMSTLWPGDQGSPRRPGLSSGLPARRLARAKVPPPLNFDQSSRGYNRSGGLLTPQPLGQRDPAPSPNIRPHTAGLAPSGLGLQIGVARGLSVKEPKPSQSTRRPDHGLRTPTGIADEFGTVFI